MSCFALVFLFVSYYSAVVAQKKSIDFDQVEPPFWWTGMKNPRVQLLFHDMDVNLGEFDVAIDYAGVALEEVKTVENPHYVFLTLDINPSARQGKIPITFTAGKKRYVYSYELKEKIEGRSWRSGIRCF